MLSVGVYYLSTSLLIDEDDCSFVTKNPPVIRFVDNENELSYDLKTSKRSLLSIKNKHVGQFSEFTVKGSTIGLTLGKYNYSISTQMGYKKVRAWGKAYCPYLREAKIDLNYDSKVYVAKEYASNRCAFDVILNHELDHHQVNVMNKRKYFDWLKTDLPSVILELSKDYEPVAKDMLQPMTTQIQTDIESALNVYVDVMNSRTESENKKLDTRAEYQRLNREIRQCYK